MFNLESSAIGTVDAKKAGGMSWVDNDLATLLNTAMQAEEKLADAKKQCLNEFTAANVRLATVTNNLTSVSVA